MYGDPRNGEDHSNFFRQVVRWSMTRVTQSQYSLRIAAEALERSRKSIEETMRRLEQSDRLVQNPFYRPWCRDGVEAPAHAPPAGRTQLAVEEQHGD